MHRFPRWVHFVDNTIIPILGYLFIAIGILQWGIHLIPIGIGILLVYWVSRIAVLLMRIVERLEEFFADDGDEDKKEWEEMVKEQIREVMREQNKEPAKIHQHVRVAKGTNLKEVEKTIKKITSK